MLYSCWVWHGFSYLPSAPSMSLAPFLPCPQHGGRWVLLGPSLRTLSILSFLYQLLWASRISPTAGAPCLLPSPLWGPPPPFLLSPFAHTSQIPLWSQRVPASNPNSISYPILSFTAFLTTFPYFPLTWMKCLEAQQYFTLIYSPPPSHHALKAVQYVVAFK